MAEFSLVFDPEWMFSDDEMPDYNNEAQIDKLFSLVPLSELAHVPVSSSTLVDHSASAAPLVVQPTPPSSFQAPTSSDLRTRTRTP